MTELEQAALSYAQCGWFVFPCEPNGKRPIGLLVPNGKDDATLDPAIIHGWWSQYPNANIGIAVAPSGLVVLDVDIAGDKQGRESLVTIDAQLTATLTARTGSGGLHAYYSRPTAISPFQRIGALAGIDLIGNGYVIAPPSVHATGSRYEWSTRAAIDSLPSVLVELGKHRAANTVTRDTLDSPITEGNRNNALFRLGAALRATNIGHQALRAALHFENRRRFDPPLPELEVDAVAESVMNRVTPERDIAQGAIVRDALADLVAEDAPESPAMWVRDVAIKPAPPTRFYSTGCDQLDNLMGGGVCTQHVLGIIGPPSVGKSAFVGSIALSVQKILPVLQVSTELPRRELMIRMAAAAKGFSWREGMKGLHDAELYEATKDLSIKMIGSDTLDLTNPVQMIAREAIALKQELNSEPPLIILDYVQLLANGTDDKTRARVGEIVKELRNITQILDCPMIAVFSTSRAFYSQGKLQELRKQNDPTVYLGAAKESGDIEYHCAEIIFLDVEQGAEGAIKPARAVLARCRAGDIGAAGYDASLAIGRWDPNPMVTVDSMSQVGHEREQRIEDEIDKKVLAIIALHPHDSLDAIEKSKPGVARAAFSDSVKRLAARGDIVCVSEPRENAPGLTHKVWKLKNDVAPEIKPPVLTLRE